MSGTLIMPDIEAASREAAERFTCAAITSVAKRGMFNVAIPGGSSPRKMFEYLASPDCASIIPWSATNVFFTDERCVPPDSADSNYRQAFESLLSKVPIPQASIHRFHGELDPTIAAADYDKEIRGLFGDFPRFDLIILGMGADMHTASLFPKTTALEEQSSLSAANYIENLGAHRLTLTLPVLSMAEQIIVIAFGEDKADAVYMAIQEDCDPRNRPITAVKPMSGRMLWILDRAAASRL